MGFRLIIKCFTNLNFNITIFAARLYLINKKIPIDGVVPPSRRLEHSSTRLAPLHYKVIKTLFTTQNG